MRNKPKSQLHASRFDSGGLTFPVVAIGLILALMLTSALLLTPWNTMRIEVMSIQFILLLLGLYLIGKFQFRIHKNLLMPLSELRHWAYRMQSGHLSAQIPIPEEGEFANLAKDINKLGESLRSLSREMDERVDEQTELLEQKANSLQILYDVAASCNTARNIEELLLFYLRRLAKLIAAKAGTVRLLVNNDMLSLIGEVGQLDDGVEHKKLVRIERCICAQNYNDTVIHCDHDHTQCGNIPAEPANHKRRLRTIAIPLQYQNRTLGIYHFFVDTTIHYEYQDLENVLANIGQHLSLAIEKARLDQESKRITIMQERTMLAHELHDSLAQTLASLRLRIRLLQNTLPADVFSDSKVEKEFNYLKESIKEANGELRELLAHFRVHMDERGLIPATETVIERFKDETGIALFFQNECSDLNLPAMLEVQVLHIIQESLTNIRKHSQATHVRVIIRQIDKKRYYVLIEDDGIGMHTQTNDAEAQPGEHVGLSIMNERAKRIGGSLNIDSESGEGTRVELEFEVSHDTAHKNLDRYSDYVVRR